MMRARFVLALAVMLAPSGCALVGFSLDDYGGATGDSADGALRPDSGLLPDGATPGDDGAPADESHPDAIATGDGSPPPRDAAVEGAGPDATADAAPDAPADAPPTDAPPDTNVPDTSLPPCAPAPTIKRVFVSSATYAASGFGGLTGADSKCNDLAVAAGIIEPFFKAWMSDDAASAASRLMPSVTTTYTLMDKSTIVACTWNELASAPHRHAIDHDEHGVGAPASPTCGGNASRAVWTGTGTSGATLALETCASWTSTSGNGAMGLAASLDDNWTSACTGATCGGSGAIYCIEQ